MADPVKRAAVITHGRRETADEALARLEAVAQESGVELVMPADELEKHEIRLTEAEPAEADIVVVLGGDGTMLRALRRLLGTTVPAIGVNYGSVGFLTTIPEEELEPGVKRVFAGDYELVDLPTLEARAGEDRRDAVNDIVATSSTLGRMIELVDRRRRGPRHAALRRPDRRDPVRLDRLQPLERRAGAGLGPGRAGGHLCRTTFPPRLARSSFRAEAMWSSRT